MSLELGPMIPPQRPIIRDAEWRNGVADIAALHARLVAWPEWTYHRDLYCSPSDPAPAVRDVSTDNGPAFGSGPGHLGVFYVPVPTSPAQRLRLHINAAGPMSLLFESSRGQVALVLLKLGWNQIDLPAAADSYVSVKATTSGRVVSLCGWWEPLASSDGVTLPSGPLRFPSRAWAAQDRPDATVYLRALAQLTSRYAATRPRMVVAKWYGNPTRRLAGTHSGGLYRVWVAESVATLRLSLRYGALPAAGVTVQVLVDGVAASLNGGGTSVVLTDVYVNAHVDLTVAVPKGAARVVELAISVTVPASSTADVPLWVGLREARIATADLGLAPGDTVPPAFPALDRSAIRGYAPILATGPAGRGAVLDALIWLYANRYRLLVSDSRVPGREVGGWFSDVNSPQANALVSAVLEETCVVTVRGAARGVTSQVPVSAMFYAPSDFAGAPYARFDEFSVNRGAGEPGQWRASAQIRVPAGRAFTLALGGGGVDCVALALEARIPYRPPVVWADADTFAAYDFEGDISSFVADRSPAGLYKLSSSNLIPIPGAVGSGVKRSGTTSFAYGPVSQAFVEQLTGEEITLDFWFRPGGVAAEPEFTILQCWSSAHVPFEVRITSAGIIKLRWTDLGTGDGGGGTFEQLSSVPVNGVWSHIAVRRTRARGWELLLNGEVGGRGIAGRGAFVPGNYWLYLGGHTSGVGTWTCLLDDVRFSSRARSDSEIAAAAAR